RLQRKSKSGTASPGVTTRDYLGRFLPYTYTILGDEGRMRIFVSAVVAAATVSFATGSLGLAAQQTPPTKKPALAASHPAAKKTAPAPPGMSIDAQNQLVKTYCVGCHSEKGRAGGLSLASFDATKTVEHADVTEKMIRKLRAGMMPPQQARRPDAETV